MTTAPRCCDDGAWSNAVCRSSRWRRDGLQSEDTILDAATKIELINRAVDAGIRRIEVCSFVNPARVPQMADAEAVLAGLPQRDDVTYIAWC